MITKKKILAVAVIAFGIYYAVKFPTDAASNLKGVGAGLASAAHGLGTFLAKLN